MDSEDSGPRRFIHLMFVLLVLLVQLDILECSAFRDQVKPVARAYILPMRGKRMPMNRGNLITIRYGLFFLLPGYFFQLFRKLYPRT